MLSWAKQLNLKLASVDWKLAAATGSTRVSNENDNIKYYKEKDAGKKSTSLIWWEKAWTLIKVTLWHIVFTMDVFLNCMLYVSTLHMNMFSKDVCWLKQ